MISVAHNWCQVDIKEVMTITPTSSKPTENRIKATLCQNNIHIFQQFQMPN